MRFLVLLTVFFAGCGCHAPTEAIVKKVIAANKIILEDGTTVLYAGIEAPEKENPWFSFALVSNAYLVSEKKVKLKIEKCTDKEITAFVYTPVNIGDKKGYLFINAEIARFGFGKVLPIPSDAANKELWQNLKTLQEKEAKPNKRGIFSGLTPEEYKKRVQNAN